MCNLNSRSIVALWSIYNQSESIAKYQAAVLLHINKEGDFMEYEIPENIAALSRSTRLHDRAVMLADKKKELLYKVYPNPASDRLFITSLPEDAQIIITDIQGKKYFFQQSGNGIDVSQLQSGVYYYQIIIEDQLLQSGKVNIIK